MSIKCLVPALRQILREQHPVLAAMGDDAFPPSSQWASLWMKPLENATEGRSRNEIVFFLSILGAVVVFVILVPAVEAYLQHLEESEYEERNCSIVPQPKTSKLKAKFSPQGVLEWVEDDWCKTMETIVEESSEDMDNGCDDDDWDNYTFLARTISSSGSTECSSLSDDDSHDEFAYGLETPTSSPPSSPESHMKAHVMPSENVSFNGPMSFDFPFQ